MNGLDRLLGAERDEDSEMSHGAASGKLELEQKVRWERPGMRPEVALGQQLDELPAGARGRPVVDREPPESVHNLQQMTPADLRYMPPDCESLLGPYWPPAARLGVRSTPVGYGPPSASPSQTPASALVASYTRPAAHEPLPGPHLLQSEHGAERRRRRVEPDAE